MHYRTLGRTGWKVSEAGFGAWAIGGSWGQLSEETHARIAELYARDVKANVHHDW